MRDFKSAFGTSAIFADKQLSVAELSHVVGGITANASIDLTEAPLPPEVITPLANGGGGIVPPMQK